ncbi:MAG TPA: Hsp20/alpha crystallin family protein [Candidatus Angelobacter sp.]|nr:Hsp20/alpha crystallin family protein [Candidatus Angelobacter sp.]
MSTLTKSENRAANGGVPEQRACISPHVNILETNEGYLLEAEMAGVSKDGLELTLEGNELTIVGKRQLNVEGAEVVYRESSPLSFKRVFELDPAIDTGKITAEIEQGVLTVNLPKAEKVKPRKITVSG